MRTMLDEGGRVRRPVLRVMLVTPWSVDLTWDDDEAATGWKVSQVPGTGRYEQTGQPQWRANGLLSDTLYCFRVFAVDEDHGEASEKALIRVATLRTHPAVVAANGRVQELGAGDGFEPPTFRL